MAEVVLDLRSKPIPEKIQKGRQWVLAITNNPDFPNPNPTLAAVTAALDALEEIYNIVEAIRVEAKQKTTEQSQIEAACDAVLTNLATYVQGASRGDEAKIKGASMEVKKEKSPSHLPIHVTDLRITHGDFAAEVDLRWRRIKNAKSYVIETATDPTAGEWQMIMIVTKTKAKVLNQPIGQKMWYRVAAIGAAGQGAWSQPVSIIVGE
ncbi:MAG: hypothetical protein NTX03_04505 [Bacteroidetes bacterium]|nr:hypothetical protein [Bacteroidota bacterium]